MYENGLNKNGCIKKEQLLPFNSRLTHLLFPLHRMPFPAFSPWHTPTHPSGCCSGMCPTDFLEIPVPLLFLAPEGLCSLAGGPPHSDCNYVCLQHN